MTNASPIRDKSFGNSIHLGRYRSHTIIIDTRCFSSVQTFDDDLGFNRGDPIQVEVMRFGRLGASVDVIGRGHNEEDIIADDEDALATNWLDLTARNQVFQGRTRV